MIYIFGWLTIYGSLALERFVKYRSKIFAHMALLVLGLIAVLRGEVGNDTFVIYETRARLLKAGTLIWTGTEPGFTFLLNVLVSFCTPVIAIRVVAFIFTFLIFVFLLRADKTEFYFSLVFIFPLFFTYSMNVLRVGLGLALLLLAFQYQRRNKTFGFLVFAFLSLMFHYSMLIPLILLWLLDFRFLSRRNVILLAVGVMIVIAVVSFGEDYFSKKMVLYVGSESPNSFSGLSKVLANMILLFGVAFSKLPSTKKRALILTILSITTAFLILSRYSYAGLRLLDLVTFSAPLLIIRAYDQYRLKPGAIFRLSLFICGIVIIVFTYRNFLSDYGGLQTGTPSPFLPYRTIFQEEISW